MSLSVPVHIYKNMLENCLQQARHPTGTKRRRRGRERHAARDACVLAFAYTCGAKSSELIRLRAEDCILGGMGSNGVVTFPDRDPRSQKLPLLKDTQKIAELWNSLRQESAPFFFYPMSKYGVKCGDELTPNSVRNIVSKWYNSLSRVKRNFSQKPNPQKLRSSFREILKREGVRDAIVRDLMGLRSRRTAPRDDETADRRIENALRLIADKASPDVYVPPPPARRL